MQGVGAFTRYWSPVLMVMALIYVGSTDVLSNQHTSRLLTPVLRWLYPGISQARLEQVHALVRKTGHVTEYALLAVLIWRGLRQPDKGDTAPFHWREAAWALSLAVAYAATDEVHQAFVRSRYGSVVDVAIDAAGAGAGLFLLWLVGCWRKRW